VMIEEESETRVSPLGLRQIDLEQEVGKKRRGTEGNREGVCFFFEINRLCFFQSCLQKEMLPLLTFALVEMPSILQPSWACE
jgi:hypothetical protein